MKARSFAERLARIIAEGDMILSAEAFAAQNPEHVALHYTIVCDTHGGAGLYTTMAEAVAAFNEANRVAERDQLPCEYHLLPIVSEKK